MKKFLVFLALFGCAFCLPFSKNGATDILQKVLEALESDMNYNGETSILNKPQLTVEEPNSQPGADEVIRENEGNIQQETAEVDQVVRDDSHVWGYVKGEPSSPAKEHEITAEETPLHPTQEKIELYREGEEVGSAKIEPEQIKREEVQKVDNMKGIYGFDTESHVPEKGEPLIRLDEPKEIVKIQEPISIQKEPLPNPILTPENVDDIKVESNSQNVPSKSESTPVETPFKADVAQNSEVTVQEGASIVEISPGQAANPDKPEEVVRDDSIQVESETSAMQEQNQDGPISSSQDVRDDSTPNKPLQTIEITPEKQGAEFNLGQNDPAEVDVMPIAAEAPELIVVDTPQIVSIHEATQGEQLRDDSPFQEFPIHEPVDAQFEDHSFSQQQRFDEQGNPIRFEPLIHSEVPDFVVVRVPPVSPMIMDNKEFFHFNVEQMQHHEEPEFLIETGNTGFIDRMDENKNTFQVLPEIGINENSNKNPEDVSIMEDAIQEDIPLIHGENMPPQGDEQGMVYVPSNEMRFQPVIQDDDPMRFEQVPFNGGINFFERIDTEKMPPRPMDMPHIQPVPVDEMDLSIVSNDNTEVSNLRNSPQNEENAANEHRDTLQALLKRFKEIKRKQAMLEETNDNIEESMTDEIVRDSDPFEEEKQKTYGSPVPTPHKFYIEGERDHKPQRPTTYQMKDFSQFLPSKNLNKIRDSDPSGVFVPSSSANISPYQMALLQNMFALQENTPTEFGMQGPLFSGSALRGQFPTQGNFPNKLSQSGQFLPVVPFAIRDGPIRQQPMNHFRHGQIPDNMYYVVYPEGANQFPFRNFDEFSYLKQFGPYGYNPYNRAAYMNALMANRQYAPSRFFNSYFRGSPFNRRSQQINKRRPHFNRYPRH